MISIEQPCGLLHSDGFNFDPPILPVEIEFSTYASDDADRVAWGHVSRWNMSEEHYVLQIGVSDPDHSIYDGLLKAMERAAISQDRYHHVEFRNDRLNLRNSRENNPDYTKMGEERRAMLKAVDDGKGDLPNLFFDEIVFDDAVSTKAPEWSWYWKLGLGKSGLYHDPKMAHYRKALKWPPLPDA